MTPPYADDAAWEQNVHAAIRAILGEVFGVPLEAVEWTHPMSPEDRYWNTDARIIRGEGRPLTVAVRSRRPGGASGWQAQVTFRYSRPSGARTEWHKIGDGFGDFMYYGFAGADFKPFSWVVLDLDIFRTWLFMEDDTALPGEIRQNKDGSSELIAFQRADLPDGCIIARDPKQEYTDALWAIVTAKPRITTPAYQWARAGLGLDDDREVAPVFEKPEDHVHGWAKVDGQWRCIQDHYAVGFAPETGCDARWP